MATQLGVTRFELIKRIVMPSNKPFGEFIGAGVGLVGDLGNFLTDNITAPQLMLLFAVAAAIFLTLCFRRASRDDIASSDDAAACRECQALRIAFYAALAFAVLMLIGQGESATARVGTQLGLIQRDVSDIKEAMASNILIENPQTAEEYYHNAFLQLRSKNDPAAAAKSLETMYKLHSPNKMDAAELYWEAVLPSTSNEALVARMADMAKAKRDANLAIVAARNVAGNQKRDELVALAKSIDPGNPFAHWDQLLFQKSFIENAADSNLALKHFRAELVGMNTAQPLLEARPVGELYFRPQYAANPLQMLQISRPTVERNVESYERLSRGGKYFQ